MTLEAIMQLHQNRFVVVTPEKRNEVSHFVEDFRVLHVQKDYNVALEQQAHYIELGYPYAVIIDAYKGREEDVMPPPKVAEFWRCYFGIQEYSTGGDENGSDGDGGEQIF